MLKINELQRKGKLVSARVRFPKLISLYKLYDFYVETYQIYTNRHKWSSIETVSAFKSTIGLRPYAKYDFKEVNAGQDTVSR